MECLFCCHTGTGTADNTLQLIRVHNAVAGGGGEGGRDSQIVEAVC